MDKPSRPWWPHVRAVLIALHVVAITLQALPSPGGAMKRSSWREPTVQGELAAWTDRLNALGWKGDQQHLEQDLWDFASEFVKVRRRVLAPFAPYYRYAGTFQSWRMFVAPHRHPARLHIEVHRRGAWEPVYVARDAQHDWLAPKLDHDRLRAQVFRLSWPAYKTTYSRFVDWVARQAASDFPDATRVRVRFWRYRTPSPAEVRSGAEVPGRWVLVQVRSLGR